MHLIDLKFDVCLTVHETLRNINLVPNEVCLVVLSVVHRAEWAFNFGESELLMCLFIFGLDSNERVGIVGCHYILKDSLASNFVGRTGGEDYQVSEQSRIRLIQENVAASHLYLTILSSLYNSSCKQEKLAKQKRFCDYFAHFCFKITKTYYSGYK